MAIVPINPHYRSPHYVGEPDIEKFLRELAMMNRYYDATESHKVNTTIPEPIYKCELCHNDDSASVYYCTSCQDYICENCWKEVRLHKPEKGLNHEQSDPKDARIVHEVLHAKKGSQASSGNSTEDAQDNDTGNMWFGVSESQDKAREQAREYMLSEGIAYEDLVLANPRSSPSITYPGLVSFVGETSAGKSALINLLIKFSSSFTPRLHTTPVVGLPNSGRSTSSNVHLYSDPDTLRTENPMLYADCEGMGGDENPTTEGADGLAPHWPKSFPPIKIQWGQQEADGTITKSRRYMTKALYPRILYIFSDVIVYVPFNKTKFEEMVLHLVKWAHNAMEQSYNKPVLPHVVIALNRQDGDVDQDVYDVSKAKQILMDRIRGVHDTPSLERYTEYWKTEDEERINSGEALLMCYYSSVKVIHFPNEYSPTRMHKQITTFYQVLSQTCQASKKHRADVQMKLNAVAFPLYIRRAFNQFASSLAQSFDFSEAWFDLNPVSFDFRSAILILALQVRKNLKIADVKLWEEMSDFIASCFLVNKCRTKIPTDGLVSKHVDQFKSAMHDYWHKFWPCEYHDPELGSCVNGRDGHVNHHFDSKFGRRAIPGMYKESLALEQLEERLINKIKEKFDELKGELAQVDQKVSYSQRVSRVHKRNVNKFYDKMGNPHGFISHSKCFSCLDAAPEHSLPCGHVICTPCVSVAGESLRGGFVQLKSCPLVSHGEQWSIPWVSSIKPDQAGVRIMTLDGGGIRGIVELEILKRIQKHLGGIPIREFFDLIVGTSAGGIISLGLGPTELDVDECDKKFVEFAKQAFSPHRLAKAPWLSRWLRYIVTAFYQGQYKTEPLEKAIKDAFPEDCPLFGGTYQSRRVPVKVAVTTTTRQSQVVVLSNYNRKPPKTSLYRFHRPGPDREMMLWEAARATSAAPTYFTPFSHTLSDQVLLDGGLYHNNPIKIADAESKAIWPESKHKQPDIVLSIGTGVEKSEMATDDPTSGAEEWALPENSELPKDLDEGSFLKLLAAIGMNYISNSLACERMWHEWLETKAPDTKNERRYRRLTVEFDDPIEMDDPKKMPDCRLAVEKMIEDSDILCIADQLIASCFFFGFQQGEIYKTWDGKFKCLGKIECRLLPGVNSSIKLLGRHWNGPNFRPYFVIKETHQEHKKGERGDITQDTIDRMIEEGEFIMDLTVQVSSEMAETEILMVIRENQLKQNLFPISGFPRRLQDDYEITVTEKPPSRVRLMAEAVREDTLLLYHSRSFRVLRKLLWK